MSAPQRPAVRLVIQSHLEILSCISMIESDPRNPLVDSTGSHQKMRLGIVRLDDIRPVQVDEVANTESQNENPAVPSDIQVTMLALD